MTTVIPNHIRPFPARLEAYPDEAAYGLLLRTAAHNGVRRPRLFLQKLGWHPGLSVAHMDPVSVARICKADVTKLTWVSPALTTKTATIMGQTILREHISATHRRWCPACLVEAPYARVWWDVRPVTHCPFHNLELVSKCSCRRSLLWETHQITSCDQGHFLQDVPAKAVSPEECIADAYIVARLTGRDHPPVPALDDASLQDAISAMENVGRASIAIDLDLFQARKKIGRSRLLNEGLRCLSDLSGAFQDLLDKVYAYPKRFAEWSGLGSHYGALFLWLNIIQPSPLARYLAEAISHHANKNNLVMNVGSQVGGFEINSGGFYRREAASAAGISDMWFDALARHLGYRPPGRSRGKKSRYSQKQVDTIRETIEATATGGDLVEQLAIVHQSVTALYDEGILVALKRPISWKNNTRCSRSDVDALLNTLRNSYEPLDTTRNDRLVSITEAGIGTPGGFRQVLRWIYTGDIRVRAIDAAAPGLQQFLVSRKEVTLLGHVPSSDFMTASRVARALSIHKSAIEEFLHAGIMSSTRNGRNWHITPQDLSQFHEKYVPATELAKLARVGSSMTLRSLMRKHGVAPCCAQPKFRQSLYLRSEAMPVLALIGGQQLAST